MPRKAHPAASSAPSAMMDTREVAAYLRLKERRIYDLVKTNALPHIRATGKLLFPRAQVDAWLAAKAKTPPGQVTSGAPPIVAGSHDPLLEWAVRESRCGLAVLACGSSAGLERFVDGTAMVAAMHWLDRATGEYNVPLVRQQLPDSDVIVIEWARRTQGLVLASGNPLKIRKLPDLVARKARIVARQPGAGSYQLFAHLLERAGIAHGNLRWLARPALAETDLATAIHDGKADAGIAIETAAHARGLAFIPLAVERLDLVMHRRDYFEAPVQALLAFARSTEMHEYATSLRGYDLTATGRVVFNA